MNDAALWNIHFMFVTPSTRQPPIGWSKAAAPLNVAYMLVTLATLQPPRSWSKAEAPLNMYFMSVTPEVSHAVMSSLKDAAAVLQYLRPE